IRNVWHFARTLMRISRSAGSSYVDFVLREINRDVVEFAQVEANLMEIVNWVRMIGARQDRAYTPLAAELIAALDEAMNYDSQVRHLLETAVALTECMQTQDARRYAEAAAREARQFRGLVQLRDFVQVLQTASWLERQLGFTGFTAQLFST